MLRLNDTMRVAAALCAATLAAATLPAQPPRFRWDTLPVFTHSGNHSGPLSNATTTFMAWFPLVTMGGFHGAGPNGGNERRPPS